MRQTTQEHFTYLVAQQDPLQNAPAPEAGSASQAALGVGIAGLWLLGLIVISFVIVLLMKLFRSERGNLSH